MSSQPRYALNKNKYLLDPEIKALEATLENLRSKDFRNTVLFRLALATGGRAQELLNLSPQDLNMYDKTVFIRGLKGSNDRELPLMEDLFEDLRQLITLTQNSPYAGFKNSDANQIFPISYTRLHQIWEAYRPVPKKFHSLRHTFAIRLYKKTRDLRLVQVALGHRNITNTMVYADYVYSQEELRRLIL